MPRCFIPTFVLLVLSAPASAQRRPAQPPAPPVTFSVPQAVAPGQTTEVTFRGVDFGDADGLWTSFPTKAERVGAAIGGGNGVTYRLTLAPVVPVGIGAVRLSTAAGVSSLQLFMIDDLPTDIGAGKNGANVTPAAAQPLPIGVAVDGNCESLAARYFRLSGKKGERVSVEVVAQRLGSKLDPIVRLLDPAGRELAYCDDTPGLGSDCRFGYTFPADGDCLIELRDANYEGGGDYRYRLRVGDFPLATNVFPLAARRGQTRSFAVEGPGGRTLAPVTVALPDDQSPCAWLGVKNEGGKGSTPLAVLFADADDQLETEPNDDTKSATPIQLPGNVSAHFDRPGDRDVYRFDAHKGDRVAFRGRTRSLGTPGELLLRLLKPDGSKLAQSVQADPKTPVTAPVPDEPTVEATIPADGTYFLSVEDLARAGGPGMAYRLEADRPPAASFALTVDVDKIEGPAGSTATVKVTCVRNKDFTGPITLSLAGDGIPDLSLENNTIKKGQNDADLKIKLPADPSEHGPVNFTIVGKASISEKEATQTVSTLPALKKLYPRLMFPPPEIDGLIGLGVRPEKTKDQKDSKANESE
jgi:hypothetical protein